MPLAIAVPNLFALMKGLNIPEPLWVAAWGLGLIGASVLYRSLTDRFRDRVVSPRG